MKRFVVAVLAVIASVSHAAAGATDYFTEMSKDFGVTPRGPILRHYFTVKNTSPNTITLGTARVSCGCVSANVMKSVLQPGESTAVEAMMDTRRIPQAYTVKSVIVYVPFLSPVLEEVSLRVQSIARDDLVFGPDTLNLGTVKKGKPATTTMKVTLFNRPNWEVTEVQSNGAFVSGEAKLIGRQGAEVTYEITAKLNDQCPVGNWAAEFTLKTNAADIPTLKVPVLVNVVTPISVSPEKLNLVGLKPATSSDFKVMLQGTEAFKVLDIKGGDDVVTVKSEATDSRNLHTLVFTIKAKEAGKLTRSIEVTTDSKEMPKVTIPFAAEATQ